MKRFSNIWANSGDTGTEPTTTKQDTGFVRREKPTRQLFNWLFNNFQQKVNDIIDGLDTTYDQKTNEEKEFTISSGLWTNDWGNASSSSNTIDNTDTIVDIKSCFVDGEPMVLVLTFYGGIEYRIKRYNARTGALESTSGNLSPDILASSEAHSMCTDGTSVYVFYESAASSNRVGKWNIVDWIYDSNWPANGVSLHTDAITAGRRPRVIIADSDNIAVSEPNSPLTGGYNNIYIIQISDGTIATSGNGDSPVDADGEVTGEIVSDGTYIYFLTYNQTTTTMRLCTAQIADCDLGSGGTAYPYTISASASYNTYKLGSAGDSIVTLLNDSSAAESDAIIMHSKSTEAFFDNILLGTPDSGEDSYKNTIGSIEQSVFDGLTLWIGTNLDMDGANSLMAVVGVNVSSFGQYEKGSQYSPIDFTQLIKGPYYLTGSATSSAGPKMAFDGRDLWCNGGDQYIYRIPQITKR